MHRALPTLASELQANERTLRRAVSRGTVRCRRRSARRLQLADGELDYLRAHWPVLATLSRALRTESNVRLAVLYGSVARGDDGPDSDVDMLVHLRDDTGRAALGIADRLEHALDRPVDLARLSRVRVATPVLLLHALDEGRVLADREGVWPALHAQRAAVAADATRAGEAAAQAAADALAELLEDR